MLLVIVAQAELFRAASSVLSYASRGASGMWMEVPSKKLVRNHARLYYHAFNAKGFHFK